MDAQAEEDMDKLFRIRAKVNSLLENARKDGVVKSSLSADVAMNISSASTSDVIDLLGREGASPFEHAPLLRHLRYANDYQSIC